MKKPWKRKGRTTDEPSSAMPPGKRVILNVWMHEQDYELLRAYAEANELYISQAARQFIGDGLAKVS